MNKIFLTVVFISFFISTAVHAKKDLSDGEIAQILSTANSIDIANGELAKIKATNPDVKTFAQRMVIDHTQSNTEAQTLLSKINLKPEDSSISSKLNDDAEKVVKKLKDANKEDFDKVISKQKLNCMKKSSKLPSHNSFPM